MGAEHAGTTSRTASEEEKEGPGGPTETTDVVVVGAGPTGLMLAGELRLGGARVTVVEQLPAPTGQSRGLGFTARAMEVFDQRGLLAGFGPGLETSPQGHFGGVLFDYSVLRDGHFGARGIPQSQTESVLEEWARALGADIRRGWQLTGLTDTGDGVEIVADTPTGVRRLRGSHLVGCDGGGSAVRTAAGFDFPGTPARRTMYLADVAGCSLRPRFLGERLPAGMVMAAPLGEGVDRIIVCPDGVPADDSSRLTDFAEVADAWQRITGEDISGGSALWVSTFTDATRQTSQYRRGRVLLAGDAAHIHLPAGGQGLSTGVQDAVNLGWKLAATVQGWAPPGLLDSYHDERHPAGARLLMNTRAQGMLYLGGEEADPMRALFGELIEHDDVKRHLAGVVSGLDVRYDVGEGSHPLLGRRLPPRPLRTAAGPTRTTELLHPGQGVLLDLRDDETLRAEASGWKDRVVTVTATVTDDAADEALAGAGALLVRPDGYIVWTAADDAGPRSALHRWFGAPTAGTTHHDEYEEKP
ncbi:FAD-dependent monooxygenase [Streptomyces anulatus]|uniref:FAD-dependent monooxygenase n=1 Tax=Streptomyces anulatus TaxID=1892 RepID=UPI000997D8F1|nr:FAD-dependent monooxygenase [Streptomyces anulatus]